MDRILFYTVGLLGPLLLAGLLWYEPAAEDAPPPNPADADVLTQFELLDLPALALPPTATPSPPPPPSPTPPPTPEPDAPFSVELSLLGAPSSQLLLRLPGPPKSIRHTSLADPPQIVLTLLHSPPLPAADQALELLPVEDERLQALLSGVRISRKPDQTKIFLDRSAPARFKLSPQDERLLISVYRLEP